MKKEIHPRYELTTITCACGATYNVRCTKPLRKLEICSACHPFFTGKQKYIDAAGRVDKFQQRYKKFIGAGAVAGTAADAPAESKA